MDFVSRLMKQKKSPGYALNFVNSVRSSLLRNELALVRRFVLATPTRLRVLNANGFRTERNCTGR